MKSQTVSKWSVVRDARITLFKDGNIIQIKEDHNSVRDYLAKHVSDTDIVEVKTSTGDSYTTSGKNIKLISNLFYKFDLCS